MKRGCRASGFGEIFSFATPFAFGTLTMRRRRVTSCWITVALAVTFRVIRVFRGSLYSVARSCSRFFDAVLVGRFRDVEHGFYARSRLSMLEDLPVVNVDCFGGEPSAANP